MKKVLRRFLRRDDGAVTVEWVVLSAVVIGLGMVVLVPVALGTRSSTSDVADDVLNVPVGYEAR